MGTPVGIIVYRTLATLADPFISGWMLWRLYKGKEEKARFAERLGLNTAIPRPRGKLVWLHGASVGETISILPLVDALRAAKNPPHILVTSGTRTSAALMAKRLPDGVIHQYAPVDHWLSVGKFIKHWQPDVSVFVESELWPEMLYQAPKPMLVGGRMSARSGQRYEKMKWFWQPLLKRLNPCLVQTETYAMRFAAAGAVHVQVGGNLKDDAPPLPADEMALKALQKAIGARPVLFAASTHPGEEEAILACHHALRKTHKDLLTIIAPRHPHRGAEIAALVAPTGAVARQRSKDPLPAKTCDIFIADSIGEMGLWYRLATVAVIGGSFIPHGGQNPLEALKLNCPLVCGPHMFNFTQTLEHFLDCNAIEQVADVAALLKTLKPYFADSQHRATMVKRYPEALAPLTGAVNVAANSILDNLK